MLLRLPCRVVILAALALPAMAAPPPFMREFSNGLTSLDGRFVQRVFDAEGRLSEESQGRVALSAPRLFRWEYEQPTPQLIVADGDNVWIYDPDLEQAQVRPQSHEEQQSPLAALIDPEELERQFIVADDGASDGLQWVLLTPRGEDPPFDACRLGFQGQALVRMQMSDALGQRTEVEFSAWQRNPRLDAATFRFAPPPGVDVIGEARQSAEVYPIQD